MQPGHSIGPYVIVGPLGAGGMGEVYRARDTRLGREVALKVLPATFASDQERLARFAREARAVAALSHPNILAIHDVGREDGVSFAIFELLDGVTLRERLQSGPLAPRKAASIAAQIARGLDAAHSHGIVHRDIKPENLLITSAGLLKVLDFGIARVVDPAETAETVTSVATIPGVAVGTVAYMSPEQLRGEAATPASDLFATGMVLHEMLTGHRPFERASHAATVAAVLHDDAPPLPPGAPPALGRIVDRLLEKAPEDRFRSALDLAFALEALSGDTGSGTVTAVARRSIRKPLTVAVALAIAGAAGWAMGRSFRPPASGSAVVDASTFEPMTFRRGTVFQARFGPRGTILYSAAWDGQPVEIFETSGVQPEARGLGLAPASLLAVSPTGDLAIARDPHFPLTYFHFGRLATVALGGGAAPHEVADEVSAADYTPDGREVALARVVNGESRIELPLGRVWYSGVAARDPISSIRVSPDGNSIAFWHGHIAADTVLSVVSRAGTRHDLVKQAGLGRGIAWTRDGGEVWSVAGVPGEAPTRLIAVRADGQGAPREVLKLPSRFRLHDLSADGDVLLAVADVTTTLYVQAGATMINRPWFSTTFVNDISPDGRFLLFTETPGFPHRQSLYYRSVDGRSPVRIAEGTIPVQSPRLSADAQRAALIRDGKVTIAPLAGQPRELVAAGRAVDMLAWDGSGHVVYATEEGALYRQDAIGDAQATLVASVRCPGGPIASTDGRVACSDVNGQIVVVGVDGSNKHTVQPSENPGRLIGWTTDNRHVYSYLEGVNPTWLGRTDVQTGNVQRIADIRPADGTGVWRIHPVRVTPDGRVTAFSVAREVSQLFRYKGLK